MNRILYITKHNPWGRGGGAKASQMYLEAFRQVFTNDIIDLCIADHIPYCNIPETFKNSENINLIAVPPRSNLSRLLSPLTGITHRYQKTAIKLLRDNIYDFCILDHSSIAGTLVKKISDKTKIITIHHNFEPDYFKDNTPNFITRTLLLPTVIKCESKAFKKSTVNIFLTKDDLNRFIDIHGTSNAKNIVTGIFETDINFIANPVPTLLLSVPTIIITGSLNNIQNTDAIRYFIHYLYPLIPLTCKIIIAGQYPNQEIINLLTDKPNITLIPNPPKMDDIIHMGNIFLSPAYTGGGIKVRVTDGLKNGLPVIAHDVSARGYEKYIENGYFKTFSNPDQFANQLSVLFKEIESEILISNEIADFYTTESSLTRAITILKQTIF